MGATWIALPPFPAWYKPAKQEASGHPADISGKGKERLYIYSELIALLEQGAEPIAYS